jgi:hypothetical protein
VLVGGADPHAHEIARPQHLFVIRRLLLPLLAQLIGQLVS